MDKYRLIFFTQSPCFIPLVAAAASFLIHVIFIGNYNYFRDEFYYIACGEHLGLGYVDHPPLIGLISKITVALFGKSIFGIRVLSVLAGSAAIYLSGMIVHELGGKRFAQLLAGLSMIFAPIMLYIYHILSMNSFDHVFWALGLYLFIKILKKSSPKLWIMLGVVLGIGLMNKISILFMGFGLFTGLVLTTHRRLFLSKWIWICAGIAGIIFLPHIIWQISNGWPTLEFMDTLRLTRMWLCLRWNSFPNRCWKCIR